MPNSIKRILHGGTMHFTGTIWRPPYEASSSLLQVTAGCTHHNCKFCSLYADLPFKFRLSPDSEVEADLKELSIFYPQGKRMFLTGANPFALSTEKLTKLAEKIHHYLPQIKTIGCFSRVTDITPKSIFELKYLHSLGYDGIIIGTETGDDETLTFMRKGYKAADITRELHKLEETGIGYHISYLNGLSGAGNGERAARKTAAVYNTLQPLSISIVALTIFPESDLYEDIKNNIFTESGEIEKLHEQRILIENLSGETMLYANTVSNLAPMSGTLPHDKERMLAVLQNAIDTFDEDTLKRYRNGIGHL